MAALATGVIELKELYR